VWLNGQNVTMTQLMKKLGPQMARLYLIKGHSQVLTDLSSHHHQQNPHSIFSHILLRPYSTDTIAQMHTTRSPHSDQEMELKSI